MERSIIDADYKPHLDAYHLPSNTASSVLQPNWHWRLRSFVLVGGFSLLGVVLAHTHPSSRAISVADAPIAEILEKPVGVSAETPPSIIPAVHSEQPVQESLPRQDLESKWRQVTVRSGDTISDIFRRLDLDNEFRAIFDAKVAARELRSIHPGQAIRIRTSERGMEELIYQPRDTHRLHITRSEDSFDAVLEPLKLEKTTTFASGEISHSLFLAGLDAGLSGTMIMQLASIFGWDIDFSLDVRAGDRFNVLYEQYHYDDKKVRDGEIVAAEFVNQGKSYKAFRYADSAGNADYYGEDGRSLRKPFLRSPVNFSRISSPFNLSRRHPVLNTIRAHRGVDYAAASGTAIIASGNGRVVFKGNKGGYGKTIMLRHGNAYSTLYGHMSKYARGLHVGSLIQQGQVIGYVGQTGLATGPHLHYEFRINGVHHNPVTVRLPSARPLVGRDMVTFKAAIQPWQAQLNVSNAALASALQTLQ
jgi:murein DD-endopeptidase MepM/ murein hydrolase activator NlpD